MTTNKIVQIPFMSSIIQQQTDGGLIDISSIVDMVNVKRLRQGKSEARVNDYFENGNSQEYLNELLQDLGLKKLTRNPVSVEDVEIIEEQQKITIKQLKELHLYKDTRCKYAGTWFTPLLAIDIVGWLDPQIRLQFNKIVYQKLFEDRINVSNKIRVLTDKITSFFRMQDDNYYMMLNYNLNIKVFGENRIGIRDSSTKEEYNKLSTIIDILCMMIDEKLLSTPVSIINKIKSFK